MKDQIIDGIFFIDIDILRNDWQKNNWQKLLENNNGVPLLFHCSFSFFLFEKAATLLTKKNLKYQRSQLLIIQHGKVSILLH